MELYTHTQSPNQALRDIFSVEQLSGDTTYRKWQIMAKIDNVFIYTFQKLLFP